MAVGYGESGYKQSYSGALPGAQVGPGGSPAAPIGSVIGSQTIDPATAQYALGTGNLSDQMIYNQMMGQLQGGRAQQETGFQLQGLGLDTQGLGIQQGALQRQMQLLPQQYGLQTQGFDLSQQAAQYGAMAGMRDLNSAQTARGAFTSAGANAHRGDINQQLQQQLANLGLQRQGAALTYKEQQAQQQDAAKQLDLQSQRLGLSKEEINTRLTNALQDLGIAGQVSNDQVLSELGKIQQGMFSPLQNYASQLSQAMNMPILAGGG